MILFVERKEVNQKKAQLMILFVERKEVNQKKAQLMMTPVRNVQGFLGGIMKLVYLSRLFYALAHKHNNSWSLMWPACCMGTEKECSQ